MTQENLNQPWASWCSPSPPNSQLLQWPLNNSSHFLESLASCCHAKFKMGYWFWPLILCNLSTFSTSSIEQKILNIVFLKFFSFLFLSNTSESSEVSFLSVTDIHPGWPFLYFLLSLLYLLFLHVLLCHLLQVALRGSLGFPSSSLGHIRVHFHIQLPWAGFYAEKCRVPRSSGSLASPSGSLWQPELCNALHYKPAAGFMHRPALHPSDVMAETAGLRGEDPTLSTFQ